MIEKACVWLPMLKELFRIERFCRVVGFSSEQTAKLMSGEKIEHSGTLYSEEHKQNFKAEKVTAQVFKNTDVDRNRLFLHINGQSVSDWFKEQFNRIRPNMQVQKEQKRGKGFRL